MPPNLAVRNYTSYPLILRFVKLHEGRRVRGRRKLDVTDLECVKPGLCAPTVSRGGGDGDQTIRRACTKSGGYEDVRIEPFSLSEIPPPSESPAEECHLTITDPNGVQMKCPLSPQSLHADVFLSFTSGNENWNLSGIHLEVGLLAITRRVDPKNWMQSFPDAIPLELLSIPGTHSSPTYRRALPSVRCQAVSLRDQLENGVRFLDVRLQIDHPKDNMSDALSLVHGIFPVALSGTRKFRTLYEQIVGFLKCNSNETVVLSLKREGSGEGTDSDLAQRLHDHYIDNEHWVTKPGVPVLGEARGKVILLRRFYMNKESRRLYSRALGIDAQVWADNSPSSCAGDVHVQDFYQILRSENIEEKIQYVRDHFVRANVTAARAGHAIHRPLQVQRGPLFINFMSASNFWKKSCWPEKIANKINPRITQYLFKEQQATAERGIGVLVIDWIGDEGNWDLVKIIIAMNDKLLIQQSKR